MKKKTQEFWALIDRDGNVLADHNGLIIEEYRDAVRTAWEFGVRFQRERFCDAKIRRIKIVQCDN